MITVVMLLAMSELAMADDGERVGCLVNWTPQFFTSSGQIRGGMSGIVTILLAELGVLAKEPAVSRIETNLSTCLCVDTTVAVVHLLPSMSHRHLIRHIPAKALWSAWWTLVLILRILMEADTTLNYCRHWQWWCKERGK